MMMMLTAMPAGLSVARGISERIEHLSHQDEELIAEKRKRIEERLGSIHESAIGDYLETTEVDGKIIERPKCISGLPREVQQNIEKIVIDGRGRAVPQLYSKLAAGQELRAMLNIDGRNEQEVDDVSRPSDAELIEHWLTLRLSVPRSSSS
jgi:hypothetical protein